MRVVLVEILLLFCCLLGGVFELIAFAEDLLIEIVHHWIFPRLKRLLTVHVLAYFLLKLLTSQLLGPRLRPLPLLNIKAIAITVLLLFHCPTSLHSKL